MTNKLFYSIILLFVFLAGSYGTEAQKKKERIVIVKTDFGNIKIKLYNETPKHRDNFIKLVNEKFYDGILFHRIMFEIAPEK